MIVDGIKHKGNKIIVVAIKLLLCAMIIAWFGECAIEKGTGNFYSYRDYIYQNDFENLISATEVTSIRQQFICKGNIISNITLYFGELNDSNVSLSLLDEKQSVIASKMINPKNYSANSWNTVPIDCDNLERNMMYSLLLEGSNLSSFVLNESSSNSEIFRMCILDGVESASTLAFGVQSTYKYMLFGNGLQFIVSILIQTGLCMALCYSALNIERLYCNFSRAEKKRGALYAFYFSIYTVLLFNPLDKIKNEAIEFSRVMGVGFNAGVDVQKRISSFSYWFIFLAIAFALYFVLVHYLRSREFEGENGKVVSALDNIVLIADVLLVLRCITFFYNESLEINIFYYSDYFLVLLIVITIGYVSLGLNKIISASKFMAANVSAWSLCLPVSIIVTHEWLEGRVFIGLQYIVSGLILIILFISKNSKSRIIEIENCPVEAWAVCFAFIPFITSLYIESVTILNQRNVFVTHIRRDYILIVFSFVILMIASVFVKKQKGTVKKWKKIAYPVLVFGFSCLWQQIPVSAGYGVDMSEAANSSILINDFLQFGDIPIIQHYGGHMMTDVWEGIIYALVNNDFTGAVASPYSGYVAVVIALAFFFFVKIVWNEDAAVLAVLLFPFYGTVNYWGLGLLTVVAAIYYVNNNTYKRAVLFWGICIWCTLYRLDLGFAFTIACVIAFAIYFIIEKNKLALKQLTFALTGWGLAGVALWFGMCFAKKINPVQRLIEFISVTFSNQNWAYSSIGDVSVTKFAFAYIFLPFISVIALLYVVFSGKMKADVGKDTWIILLILGISYFCNFSRGLVRHSLIEGSLSICTWSAYVFLSLFAVARFNSRKLFLPSFTAFIILAAVFQSDSNFSEACIADNSLSKIGTYSETWTLDRFAQEEAADGIPVETYWSQLADNHEVIERVRWTIGVRKIVRGYQMLTDTLLEDGETYVDLINKTAIYSLIGREDPAYVSQSPLQLSGQYAQEEFIKEIEGVPIVLMPCDSSNYWLSEALDGVPNAYRYYKVFEFVYQNYVPLCKYQDQFAVWCLAEKYDELREKVEKLRLGTDIEEVLASSDLVLSSEEKVNNSDGTFSLNCTGTDPSLWNLEIYFDITPYYIDGNLTVEIDYETDMLGDMQIFYTSEENEEFSGDRVVTYACDENEGTASFSIPVTMFTKLRFDTPDGSNVKIKAFRLIECDADLIEYGYDGPYLQTDGVSYSYLPAVHNYNLDMIPVIWAEGDQLNSADNAVLSDLSLIDGCFRYSMDKPGAEGNYLKVNITYDGIDQGGRAGTEDETTTAALVVGSVVNNRFEIKYFYHFIIKEGQHDYMFRISNDYYWYIGETNAVRIESESHLRDISMQLLEGD